MGCYTSLWEWFPPSVEWSSCIVPPFGTWSPVVRIWKYENQMCKNPIKNGSLDGQLSLRMETSLQGMVHMSLRNRNPQRWMVLLALRNGPPPRGMVLLSLRNGTTLLGMVFMSPRNGTPSRGMVPLSLRIGPLLLAMVPCSPDLGIREIKCAKTQLKIVVWMVNFL